MIRINPALIRSWAHRGKISRHGRDKRGRTLYNPDEVIGHAVASGLTPQPPGS